MSVKTVVIILAFIILFTGATSAEPVSIPGLVTIKASTKEAPPVWAVMQRHLIKTMNEAAPLYLEKFTYPGGTMRGHGKLDDDYECFNNWPLFYIIGGGDKFLEWSLRQWNATTREWTYQQRKSVYKEFNILRDPLHLSEAYVGFQYLGLADPFIPENIDRACRFAGFYLNEDPEALNYDPEHKIIRSMATGSTGPADRSGAYYTLKWEHASLYPVVKDLKPDWDKDPVRREEIQKIYNKVVVPNDIPLNLTITGLVTNAYIYTGDEKYKNWVLEYVDAWMERARRKTTE